MIILIEKDRPHAIINTCAAKLRAIRSSIRQIWQPYENKFTKEDLEIENEIAKINYNTGTFYYYYHYYYHYYHYYHQSIN